MTGAHRSPRAARFTLWLPGLAVTLGAAVATAHGLYQVALAAAVPAGIAWLYPLITDGLALVAYSATGRLTGSAARYAWAVVITAAGLSGLAQAVYLASGATLDASPTLRFGIGAWPAIAAAVAAHLLYLLTVCGSTEPQTQLEPIEVAGLPTTKAPEARVQQVPSNRQVVQPVLSEALDASARPCPAPASCPTPPSTDPEVLSTTTAVTPARARARAAALRHAERHGALPTVSVLAAAADVSRGTAATVLKPLRSHPPTRQMIHAEPGPTRAADNAIDDLCSPEPEWQPRSDLRGSKSDLPSGARRWDHS
jgi:hypothetical protein